MKACFKGINLYRGLSLSLSLSLDRSISVSIESNPTEGAEGEEGFNCKLQKGCYYIQLLKKVHALIDFAIIWDEKDDYHPYKMKSVPQVCAKQICVPELFARS